MLIYAHKNGKIALNFFTLNALLIQENFAKIAQLHNFLVGLISSCVLYLFSLCFVFLFCFFISTIALVVNKDIL